VAFRLDIDRESARRLAKRPVGLFVKAGRIEHLAEVEPGLVANGLRRRCIGEKPLENFTRLAVLAERQVEAAAQELGIACMRNEPALVAVSREPDQRIEIVLLVEMEQYVAVVQVLDLHRGQPRDRVLFDDGSGDGRRRERRKNDECSQHPASTPRRGPRTRAGASSACR
jgi:hypothetical protein